MWSHSYLVLVCDCIDLTYDLLYIKGNMSGPGYILWYDIIWFIKRPGYRISQTQSYRRPLFLKHTLVLPWPHPSNGWYRPAKSGKWRECHSRKFLDCAEICHHKHNKTKGIYVYFRRFQDIFGNSLLFFTTKQREALIWFLFFYYAETFPQKCST